MESTSQSLSIMASVGGSGNTSSSTTREPFFEIDHGLNMYAHWYWNVHGYLSLVICTFGIITNVLNIYILTRPTMRTPINCVLTAIAMADVVTMSSYIPFSIHFYLLCGLETTPERYSYLWTTFLAIHGNLTTTSHAISIWLAVFMAIMRYVYLQTKKCPDIRTTCVIVSLIPFAVGAVMMPNYMMTTVIELPVQSRNRTANSTGVIYTLPVPVLGSEDPSILALVAFWLYSIMCKLVPCVLISLFIGLLLKKLHESAVIQKRLYKASNKTKKKNRHKSTTMMLLVIIVMYILTELPQVVVILMSANYKYFFLNVYMLLADTLDMAALVNNAINFVLYCSMSQQFRDHLYQVFAVFACKPAVPQPARKFSNNATYDTVNNHSHLEQLVPATTSEHV
ncbi:G-protein coupled receptor dmsr-1-like [Gigantopelta aegis]|uniref:G-protein coupled receptor dmsr-1-like n=1 Tax=Gigantopelta aegis TaxID=1735272 RepID=UPI001B88BE32|nr:G-protein coupled receptor dmsr-1-like [Gigantopelta aegis]